MPIFRYFLVHNFSKNQYFYKPISLPIYIFQGGSFEVSNMKIYFFHIFFTKGSPLWFFRISKRNAPKMGKFTEKRKTVLNSVKYCPSFAPWAIILKIDFEKMAKVDHPSGGVLPASLNIIRPPLEIKLKHKGRILNFLSDPYQK